MPYRTADTDWHDWQKILTRHAPLWTAPTEWYGQFAKATTPPDLALPRSLVIVIMFNIWFDGWRPHWQYVLVVSVRVMFVLSKALPATSGRKSTCGLEVDSAMVHQQIADVVDISVKRGQMSRCFYKWETLNISLSSFWLSHFVLFTQNPESALTLCSEFDYKCSVAFPTDV